MVEREIRDMGDVGHPRKSEDLIRDQVGNDKGAVPDKIASSPPHRIDSYNRAGGELVINGKPVRFSLRENNLFAALVDGKGGIVERDELCTSLGRDGKGPSSDMSLGYYIRKLRKKVEIDPTRPKVIITFNRRGYKLARMPPNEQEKKAQQPAKETVIFTTGENGEKEEEIYQLSGGFTFYPERYSVSFVDGRCIDLTFIDNRILLVLARDINKFKTNEEIAEIAEVVWERNEDVGLVKKYIQRLRNKIGAEWIQNRREIGYRLYDPSKSIEEKVLSVGQISYYPDTHSAVIEGVGDVKFTPIENQVFYMLIMNSGEIVEYSVLARIWEEKDTSADAEEYIKKYIQRVRRKIEPGVPAKDSCIHFVHGFGYRFIAPST